MSDGVKLFSPEGQKLMDEWRSQVDEIEQWGKNLTGWEQGFVTDIRERLDADRPLTDRQAEILERIYTERTP